MNRIGNGIIASTLAITLLAGCSNVTHGFDEESVFYTKPTSEKEIKKVDETPKTKVKKEELKQENETTISYDPYEGE